MGIRRHSLEFIHEVIDKLKDDVEMLDMGNTYIKGNAIDYIKENYEMEGFNYVDGNVISKEYFTALGYKHTSIDLNQKENAMSIDMRKPIIEDNIINKFDVILDIGTSEHIEYQYMNFKNLYDMCKTGGLFIHVLPREGYWKKHCKYKYNFDFFKQLAKRNEYEILILDIRLDKDICCCMKKTNNKGFMLEDDFNKLSLVVEEGNNFNDRDLYPYAYDK